MKIKQFIIQLLIAIAIITLSVFLYHLFFSKKFGYVKTGNILERYEGMKKANETFMSELKIVMNNIDTLQNRLEVLRLKESHISPDEKKSWAMELGAKENELHQYSQSAEEQLKNRKVQLTENVVLKINKAIQEYGKTHGYSYIFGTTADGNIIFAKDSDDLTEAIIEILNANSQFEVE